MGTSERRLTSFKSTIYYHTSNPKWQERFSIVLPPSMYELGHIFIIVRTCSANSCM
jgi:hypothetical protein